MLPKDRNESQTSNLKCIYINARSIINKLDELQATVAVLNPDIVGITESWAHDNILDGELSLPGFDLFRCDRTSTKGGGVLLYVLSELRPTAFNPHTKFPEQIWCELYANTAYSIKIGILYKTMSKLLYDDNIDDLIQALMQEMSSQHFVLMGDFNYPDIDWDQHQCSSSASKETKKFLDVIDDSFVTQHVTFPTRMNATLDLVISDEENTVFDVGPLGSFSTSDHDWISFQLCSKSPTGNTMSSYRNRDYNKADTVAIEKELSGVDWDLGTVICNAINRRCVGNL